MTGTSLPPARKAKLCGILPIAALSVAIPTTRVVDFSLQTPPRMSKLYCQDERFWSLDGRSLDPLHALEVRHGAYQVDLPFMEQVAQAWPSGQRFSGEVVVVCHGLGGYSFTQPPSVHFIDPCGLADRFMASLPFRPQGFWKAGTSNAHCPRDMRRLSEGVTLIWWPNPTSRNAWPASGHASGRRHRDDVTTSLICCRM